MNVAIDIGNSRIKLGFFGGDTLLDRLVLKHQEFFEQEFELPAGIHRKVAHVGVLTTGTHDAEGVRAVISGQFPYAKVLEITHQTQLPIRNGYHTPETLGIDRIMAALGALMVAGKGPLLVIGAGTALTYEYVDEAGVYQGGGIAPGMRLRFKALNDHTAKLPLIEPSEAFSLVGRSTEESILSGVINGLISELNGIIEQYRELAGNDLNVFLAGGDSGFLRNHLKNINFTDSNLALKGINAVIRYHKSEQ